MTGQELRNLRIENHLLQKDLADRANIQRSRIMMWEKHDAVIPRKEVTKINKALDSLIPKKRVAITHPPRGKEIAELRRTHGLSQEGLAGMVGVSQSNLSSYEAGVEPPPDVSDSLCEVFGIPYEDKRRQTLRTSSGVRFGW